MLQRHTDTPHIRTLSDEPFDCDWEADRDTAPLGPERLFRAPASGV